MTRWLRSQFTIVEAIKKAGYATGKDIKIAMDCTASEFAVRESGNGERRMVL